MKSTQSNQFAALIEDFHDDAVRNSLGPALALISPGNWDGLIEWGAAHGYRFDAHTIHDQYRLQPTLSRLMVTHPVLRHWSPASLERYIDARPLRRKVS